MALRLTQQTQEAWQRHLAKRAQEEDAQWRPVPRAEPAPEPSSNTFDIYSKTWVDT